MALQVLTSPRDHHGAGLHGFENGMLDREQRIDVSTLSSHQPQRVAGGAIVQKGCKHGHTADRGYLLDLESDVQRVQLSPEVLHRLRRTIAEIDRRAEVGSSATAIASRSITSSRPKNTASVRCPPEANPLLRQIAGFAVPGAGTNGHKTSCAGTQMRRPSNVVPATHASGTSPGSGTPS